MEQYIEPIEYCALKWNIYVEKSQFDTPKNAQLLTEARDLSLREARHAVVVRILHEIVCPII